LLSKKKTMKDKSKKHNHHKNPADKDTLSQKELIAGTSTFSLTGPPHAALETPDGKNNGAEPAIYQNERKSRT
jgi:hypothetical protein